MIRFIMTVGILTSNNDKIGVMGQAVTCLDASDLFTGTRSLDDQALQLALGSAEYELHSSFFAQKPGVDACL